MSRRQDAAAAAALIGLWLLFFWRLFTPIAADQMSLKQGDFSGQFVAFAAYQYDRFSDGEIPLWNPYNNGGLPFIADTQAAVFYPPRLITIALANLSGGWTYHALELEMTAHVLAYTLMLYAFVRVLLRRQPGAVIGGLVAAVVGGYSGFLSGYPPLQLALLEAGIWLPLAALGVHLASERDKPDFRWLVLTGLALGLSWLAGHPQTSFLLTYFLLAYWGYRVYSRRFSLWTFAAGALLFGLIAGGLATVQLLPGFEYLSRTTRAGFGYDAKSNGFPLQDVAQFVFPGVVSLYSPLHVGILGLALALIAVGRRLPGALFWGIVALIAVVWSFGGSAALYPLLYNVLPGLRFFRGQERGAYLVANSLAVLAGLGAAYLIARDPLTDYAFALRVRNVLNRVFWAVLTLAGLVFALWIGNTPAYGTVISRIALGTIMIGVAYLLLPGLMTRPQRLAAFALLPALIVLELFTAHMGSPAVYDAQPPTAQVSMTPPPLVAQALADSEVPFRVDGVRGLTANYGSLYALADIRGISPLFLSDTYALIEGDLPDAVAWELFAVRYVFSDWQQLPIPAQIVGSGTDAYGAVNLHLLDDPRPFALIVHNAALADSDAMAHAMLRDPGFDARQTIILHQPVDVNLSGGSASPAQVTGFRPESFTVRGSSQSDALLSVALPHYPGWTAAVNGGQQPILRAYAGLSAVVIPAGEWEVRFTFDPIPYRIGAILSILTIIVLIGFGVWLWLRAIRYRRGSRGLIGAPTPS